HRRDRPRHRLLAMFHVTNGALVHVRLGPLKFLFCHFSAPKSKLPKHQIKKSLVPLAGIGPATSPLPRECSTTEPQGQRRPAPARHLKTFKVTPKGDTTTNTTWSGRRESNPRHQLGRLGFYH